MKTPDAGEIGPFSGPHRFLSNFFAAPFAFDGETWATAEHAYQAMKARDAQGRARVRAAETPGQAKRLGRKVALRPDWEAVKFDVMEAVVTAKFRDPGLARRLLATGDRPLVEINHWSESQFDSTQPASIR